jgi:hypothetical protein
MHLRNRPVYYCKDGQRTPVYYTVDARDLENQGWVREEAEAPAAEPEFEKVTLEVKVPAEPEAEESPDFELMTRADLLKYAEERGVDLRNNASKAELLEACKQIGNG